MENVSPSGTGFSFKPGHTTPATQNAGPVKWKIFPNPATNLITITNGTGPDEATCYRIDDMEGCIAKLGAMTGGSLNVNITNLAPGSYVLELLNGDKSCGSTKFIKN